MGPNLSIYFLTEPKTLVPSRSLGYIPKRRGSQMKCGSVMTYASEVFCLKTKRCLTTPLYLLLIQLPYHQCKKVWVVSLFSFLSMTIIFFCCDVSSSSKSTILARSRFRKFLIAFAVSSRFSGKPLQMLRKNI